MKSIHVTNFTAKNEIMTLNATWDVTVRDVCIRWKSRSRRGTIKIPEFKTFFFFISGAIVVLWRICFSSYISRTFGLADTKFVIVLYTYVKKKVINAIKRRGFDLSPQIAHGCLTNSELISVINTLQRSSVTRFKSCHFPYLCWSGFFFLFSYVIAASVLLSFPFSFSTMAANFTLKMKVELE